MSQPYGGNPYETGRQDSYGQYGGNPYSSEGGYGQNLATPGAGPLAALSQQNSAYSQSNYSPAGTPGVTPGVTPGPQTAYVTAPKAPPMSNQDFLSRVEGVRTEINNLSQQVSSIATVHQRVFSSPDQGASQQLESLTTQTQILNTRIKDEIRALEIDAKRSPGNATKDTQVKSLKQSFKNQLEQFRKEESEYGQRYRDQIKRQFKIVNPEATDAEVNEAADADWGNDGVFQTALKSNRSGHASSVLGAVRARHLDIQQIEKTLIELNQLFSDLAEAVVIQEPAVQAAEEQTTNVHKDTEAANVQLTKATKSARNARKLKWWCLFICVAIVIILALVLGLFFGLRNN